MKISHGRIARWSCWGAAAVVVVLLGLAAKPWDLAGVEPDHPRKFLALYGWWAGAFNALVLFGMGAAAPLWVNSRAPSGAWLAPAPAPRWFLPGLVGAALLAAGLAAPRLAHSLWDDEENSVRRLVVGQYKLNDEGEWRFRPTKWEAALWNYRRPTNHHLQTLASKAFHETWRAVTRPTGYPFSEAVIRLPSLLAGAAGVIALGLLLGRLGFPRAGLAGAVPLALHPWFLRYASEARGYSLAMLFLTLSLLALLRAVESGKWRWWLAFAAGWFAMLYANPGTLFVMVVMNLAALAALLLRNPAEIRWGQTLRWAVTGCFAGMVFVQLMVPCVPQAVALVRETMHAVLTPRWHANLFAHFLTGLPWSHADTPDPAHPQLRWVVESVGLSAKLLIAAFLFLAAAGWARLALRRPAGWIVASVWVLPPVLVYASARVSGTYLYEWYLIFALPGLLACAALGADLVALGLSKVWKPAGWTALALIVAVFGAVTFPARKALRERPLEYIREAAESARGGHPLFHPHAARFLVASAAVDLETYEPGARKIESLADLDALISEARQSGRTLMVVRGNPWALGAQDPGLMKALSDPAAFEVVADFPGFDPTLNQRVLRLR